jgi:hypothetical protein
MISHILLTGAGFSHNWGGYLASEAFEYLLTVTEHDEDLRSVLWADKAKGFGFEYTLTRLQQALAKKYTPQGEQDLQNLTTAVRRMFGDMWLAFSQTPFDDTTDPRLGIIRFLTRFDAIFTLNQDTLLEEHYLRSVGQDDFARNSYQGPRNIAAARPGLVRAMDTLTFGSLASRIPLYKAAETFSCTPHIQPYFKLHGSIDVQEGARDMMLILGGNKEADIAKHPLLEWYHEQFRWRLRLPGARLMIIGYSFADAHINKMIFEAIDAGLKIFLIGPDGADTIGANKSFPLNPGPAIKNAIIGASRRPLRNTLSGRDMVELMKIERFFQDGRMAVTYQNPPL